MSNKSPVGDKNTDHDRTVSLRDYAALEKELSALKELIDIRSDGEKATLQDVWIAGQPVGRIIESNRKTAKSAKKEARAGRSNPSDPKGESGKNGDESGDDGGMLPIERIAEAENRDDATMGHVTASVDRAATLFKRLPEWSSKVQGRRVLKTSGRDRGAPTLKDLMNSVLDTTLSWKQIYRSCRKLSEWSKGAITFKKTRRHGWLLEWQPSSVGNGG